MMQPVTFVGALVCMGALVLRYRSQRSSGRRSTRRQQFKTAKVLVSALLVLLAINYALRRFEYNLDGAAPAPSLMERLVVFLSK
jgi:hypothetical protein